ncbi:hypothetical protein G7Y89_g3669 [Cudoniella acicularis]|uniref:2EXR domain-containing protein n=1 Tax=Cudoniella acicularis TaxID=354080 RepID=A0A8H4W4Z7_9HELO|nr:hypothetical protein G7Y89_g3669 [Cudoniella acicularis]
MTSSTNTESSTGLPCRTFTCFPKLPLEVRLMIWGQVANLPRNLDVWSKVIGHASWQWEARGPASDIELFKFVSTQPIPAILLVNKESYAIGKKYYRRSFGHYYDINNMDIKITTPGTILRNFNADRICPMGRYGSDAHLEMWCSDAPPSCAVNIYVKPSRSHLPGPIEKIFGWANEIHEEILLYHCREEFDSPGQFEFVGITEDATNPEEWQALVDAKKTILSKVEAWEEDWRAGERRRFEKAGMKPPKDLGSGLGTPEIKLVAIVVDGIGTLNYRWDDDPHDAKIRHEIFRFTSTQPLLGILLACKNAEKIAWKHYREEFGVKIEWSDENIRFKVQSEIWFNYKVDRACLMGSYSFKAYESLRYYCLVLSRAINVATTSVLHTLESHPGRTEFLLYFRKENSPTPGNFEFIDTDEENSSTEKLTRLRDAKQKLVTAEIENKRRLDELDEKYPHTA